MQKQILDILIEDPAPPRTSSYRDIVSSYFNSESTKEICGEYAIFDQVEIVNVATNELYIGKIHGSAVSKKEYYITIYDPTLDHRNNIWAASIDNKESTSLWRITGKFVFD